MIPFSLEMPTAIHFGSGSLAKLPDVVAGLGNEGAAGRRRRLAGGVGMGKGDCEQAHRLHRRTGELPRGGADNRVPGGSRSGRRSLCAGRHCRRRRRLGAGFRQGAFRASALPRPCGALPRGPAPAPLPFPGRCLPWIAVPTTAGTGAEATKNAVVRAPRLGVKRSMRSPHLLARAVIVDPDLTVSLPARVTGTSGLDALTQLVEAYVSRTSSPLVQSMVEGAFPPMLDALRGLCGNPGRQGPSRRCKLWGACERNRACERGSRGCTRLRRSHRRHV